MARTRSKTSTEQPVPAEQPVPVEQPAPTAGAATPVGPEVDLSLVELAQGVLARQIRPRVGQLRRLAQAVLEAEEKRAKHKAKADGKKKSGDKKRKLAKIPGQKKKRA